MATVEFTKDLRDLNKHMRTEVLPFLIKICSKLNLIALASSQHTIEVCRFNGQHVFSYEREEAVVESIAWQISGNTLSIIWNDGLIELLDCTCGKLLQSDQKSVDSSDPSDSLVAVHNYSTTPIEPLKLPPQDGVAAANVLIDDWADLSKGLENLGLSNTPDETQDDPLSANIKIDDFLPRYLALMDIESELPRLSPLPHTEDLRKLKNPSPEQFRTQGDVDAAFADPARPNELDIVLTSWNDGTINATIPGFLSDLITSCPSLHGKKLVAVAFHPTAQGLSLLTRSTNKLNYDVQLHDLQPTPIHASRYMYSFILKLTSHLSSASRYITHTVLAMRSAYTNASDLPSRFISLARETLQESPASSPVREIEMNPTHQKLDLDAALYQAAVTGYQSPQLRLWLTDTLQDRNLKRWESAVTSGLQSLIDLLHMHLLPALERASVLASRLRGLSRTDPPIPVFAVNEKKLSKIMNDVDHLRLIAHHLLRYAIAELREFKTFIAWLSHMLAIASTDSPDAPSAADAAEKAAALDLPQILTYISGPLLKSHLPYFLARSVSDVENAPRNSSMASMLPRALDGHKKRCVPVKSKAEGGMSGGHVELANVLWWAFIIGDGVSEVVRVPKEAVVKGLEVSQGRVLEDFAGYVRDVRRLRGRDGEAITLVLSVDRGIVVYVDDGASTRHRSTIPFRIYDGEVVDNARFAGDDTVFALFKGKENSTLKRYNGNFTDMSNGPDLKLARTYELVDVDPRAWLLDCRPDVGEGAKGDFIVTLLEGPNKKLRIMKVSGEKSADTS